VVKMIVDLRPKNKKLIEWIKSKKCILCGDKGIVFHSRNLNKWPKLNKFGYGHTFMCRQHIPYIGSSTGYDLNAMDKILEKVEKQL